MNNKNEVFEYLIDQLRQQVNSHPYKQQCEDLAHEVQSLKNQLRDALAQIKELQKELDILGCEYRRALDYALSAAHEQSGCRDDAARVEKSWVEHDGAAACPVPDDTVVDIKFRNGEVESNTKALWWSWGTSGGPYEIVEYRVVKPGCEHDWYFYDKGASMMCKKCGLKK